MVGIYTERKDAVSICSQDCNAVPMQPNVVQGNAVHAKRNDKEIFYMLLDSPSSFRTPSYVPNMMAALGTTRNMWGTSPP
jgi:hypothetical protein